MLGNSNVQIPLIFNHQQKTTLWRCHKAHPRSESGASQVYLQCTRNMPLTKLAGRAGIDYQPSSFHLTLKGKWFKRQGHQRRGLMGIVATVALDNIEHVGGSLRQVLIDIGNKGRSRTWCNRW